mgnify:CR=1 FL=1|tara:strand:- start:5405 stop:5725 length:321 start_codon:yes stop_codon:yes gene_type:complete
MGILEYAKKVLLDDTRFFYLGKGNNLGMWSTVLKEDEITGFIDFTKPMGQKTSGCARVILYAMGEHGLEFKIDLYIPSHCEWYAFFEGHVMENEEFDLILKATGLK